MAGGPSKDVFYVGDEFQSIYAFRHADVGVFRSRRARAAQRLTLTQNYRSRPEVLAAVNHVFGEEFGDGYQALAASGDFPDPVFGHPVELLVTDKEAYRDSGEHWRRAEARHVARRVRELVDTGAAEPGEIVLLFAAGTDAEWYEEELRALGLPTFRATGRRYFGQQQVVDLLMYLRLLRNRYDDEALAAVLASPFVGVSNDALVLIRRHAGRRPLFTGIERSLPEPLSAGDERLRARVQAALRAARGRVGARLARAAVRARRLGARLRPRRPRALGRAAPVREPAQADAARAHLRGGAGARPRRLPRLPPRPGGPRRGAARGGLRGGRVGRRAAADDPCRQGARVQGRGRRRRRARARRGAAGRTRSWRSPTAASGSRSPIPSRASRSRSSATRRWRVPGARRPAPSGSASTTSR